MVYVKNSRFPTENLQQLSLRSEHDKSNFSYLLQISKSDMTKVTLTQVDRATAGLFKCEVSADGPLFHTDIASAHLNVAGKSTFRNNL